MEFSENITVRKRETSMTRTQSLSNTTINEDSCCFDNTTLDGTSISLPNISDDDNDARILELKNEIVKLKLELSAAHAEIDNLSLENNELKKNVKDISIKHDIIKKATKQLTSEISTTPKKNKNNSTPIKINSQVPCKIIRDSPCQSPRTSKISPIITLPPPLKKTPKKTAADERNKICILSSNSTNRILSNAEEVFPNFKICHYLTPNCGFEKLIENLQAKLINYTLKDYCIIHIGDEDFHKTNSYCNLIVQAREVLKNITHTNVILCLPTYNLNGYSLMHNWRIETFNNMIYIDNLSHNYAWILDSNQQLSYDNKMFSARNGKLNNRGMLNIYQNLKHLIDDLTYSGSEDNAISPGGPSTSKTINETNLDFFRL